jgi:cytoskeletal protein RodZ
MGEVVTGGPLSPAAVGAEIARLRTQAGWTTEQLAGALKIAPRQLRLLEQGAWEQLPSPLFVRSVLKRVAEWGDCSAQTWLAAVDAAFPVSSLRLTPPSNAEGEIVGYLPFWQRRSVHFLLLLVGVTLLAVAYLNWFGVIDPFGRQEHAGPSAAVVMPREEPDEGRLPAPSSALPVQGSVTNEQASPAPGASQETGKAPATGGSGPSGKNNAMLGPGLPGQGTLPAPQPQGASAVVQSVPDGVSASQPVAPSSTPLTEKGKEPFPATTTAEKGKEPSALGSAAGLVVRAKGGDSWLRVTAADGRVRFEGIVRDGNERQFPADGAPYALHIGNAQALILSWQGEAVALPGKGTARLQVPSQKEKGERRDE